MKGRDDRDAKQSESLTNSLSARPSGICYLTLAPVVFDRWRMNTSLFRCLGTTTLALLLAGCSDDSSSGPSPATDGGATPASDSATPAVVGPAVTGPSCDNRPATGLCTTVVASTQAGGPTALRDSICGQGQAGQFGQPVASCPGAGRLGRCTVTQTASGIVMTSVFSFYAPHSLSYAQATCTQQMGSFAAN